MRDVDDDRPPNVFSVMLNYQPLGLVRATTRTIRADGLSVDTGPIALPRNSAVEVTFSVRKDNRTHLHRFNAVVRESDLEGTHLAFHSCPPETFAALRELA